ncbi:MAG: hypothetical protein J1G04_04370 [Clostridiales bacterium]|nr:hypothetical protein [Clostridiales bacterium]
MDKYSGCNKVESVTYTPKKPETKKGKRSHGSFLVRLSVCCVLVAGIVAAAYIPSLSPYKKTLKSVICYDMFGHNDIGAMPIISRLI